MPFRISGRMKAARATKAVRTCSHFYYCGKIILIWWHPYYHVTQHLIKSAICSRQSAPLATTAFSLFSNAGTWCDVKQEGRFCIERKPVHAPLAPNDPNSITHQLTASVSHLTSPNPLHGWHLAHICSFPLKPLYLSGDLRVTVVWF